MTSPTNSASVSELTVSSSLTTGSPTPSLEVPTDSGPDPLSAPNLTALLLVVAASLCVEP